MNFCQKILSVTIFTAVFWGIFSQDSDAQRTADKQYYLDVHGSSSLLKSASLGGTVAFGQYFLSSRWEVAVEGMMKRGKAEYWPVYVQGTYMKRFCANRSRSVNLYGGVGALMGIEVGLPEIVSDTPGYTQNNSGINIDFSEVEAAEAATSAVSFLYGVHAKLETEMFLFKKVALVGSVSMPITVGSPNKVFHLLGGIGLRFNI